MSTTTQPSEKGSADEPGSNDDIALIDEQTIRQLEDEPADSEGCRFAAVARSLETTKAPNTQFEFPTTVVAYVDESGRYALEREFFGHCPNWHEIPRTIVVGDDTKYVVRRIPDSHRERYAPILETYQRVLSED